MTDTSAVDASVFPGESVPVEVGKGDAVTGATVNSCLRYATPELTSGPTGHLQADVSDPSLPPVGKGARPAWRSAHLPTVVRSWRLDSDNPHLYHQDGRTGLVDESNWATTF